MMTMMVVTEDAVDLVVTMKAVVAEAAVTMATFWFVAADAADAANKALVILVATMEFFWLQSFGIREELLISTTMLCRGLYYLGFLPFF